MKKMFLTKAFSLLAVLLLMPLLLLAQYTLSGEVYSSQTNEALAGANVRLHDPRRLLASRPDGSFRINQLPAGTYKLSVSHVGYKSWEQEINVTENQHLIIKLEDDGLMADEVVVTATRATDQTPITYTEISEADLKKQNLGQDIPYLLQFTPSVVATSDAGAGVGYTGLRIRGTDATRINVTVNGIPLNDSESHGVFWVNTPDLASSVDNIQIQRGVGTSTNGAAAFGATVNIQTERLNPEPYAEAQLSAGSFNTQRYTVKAGTGLLNKHFAVDARLSKIASDGFVDRAASDLKSFYISGGYYDDKTLLKANIISGKEKTYQAWWGVPESMLAENRSWNYYTYDNETDNYQQDHYQLLFGRDLTDKLLLNLAFHYTYGRGYYEQFREADALSFYQLPDVTLKDTTISGTDLIRQRWLDNHFWGFTYSTAWEPAGPLKLTLGGGWNRYDGDHFGEVIWARYASTGSIRHRYYDNAAQKEDFNVFTKGFYELNTHLNLFADLQYRRIDYTFGGLDHGGAHIAGDYTYHFFNPKMGLNYAFNPGNRLYVSYAVANREPVRSDFIDAPTARTPLPETLHNIEAGYEASFGRQFQFGTNFYLMRYRNQLVLTGELNDVGSPIRINVPNSYRAGIETQLAWQPLELFKLEANATLSRNRIERYQEVLYAYNDDFSAIVGETRTNHERSPISFSPALTGNLIASLYPVSNLELSWLSRYVSRQYLDNTGTESRSLNAYWINDLRLNYLLPTRFTDELRLNLLVNNVFNHLYESNGYTYGYQYGGETYYENYYYPQAGINFLLGLSVRF